MGNKVERVQTNVSESQMAQAMIEAWKEMFGTQPSKEQIAILFAQNALETGHRKSMWNYNIGNIKAQENGPYDYFYLHAPEQVAPGSWKKLTMPFRAYSSLKDGVKDYISLLSKSKRYADAWSHVVNPDPASFSKALKSGGYYTANEAPYTKLLTSIYSRFTKSDNYENAVAGKISPTKTPTKEVANKGILDQLNKMLDSYLGALAKKILDKNNLLIKINSNDLHNSVEYSRILCEALEEEILAKTYIHSDGVNVEIECKVYGNPYFCKKTVSSLCKNISEAFKYATQKYENIEVDTEILTNKKSELQYLDDKLADVSYRKFRFNLLAKQG